MRSLLRTTFAPFRRPGQVDGAWWPQSRDLAAELPELFPALQRRFGLVEWLRLSWVDWDTHPKRTWNGVPVGWNREMLSHLLVSTCRHGASVSLLVVPVQLDKDIARRALDLAADSRAAPCSAEELLSKAKAPL